MLHYSATLLNAVSATGSGAAVSWPGGDGIITGSGTFGGSTLTLEYRAVDGSWVTVPTPAGATVSLTSPGMTPFRAPVGNLRGVLTGGAPSAVSATVGTTAL